MRAYSVEGGFKGTHSRSVKVPRHIVDKRDVFLLKITGVSTDVKVGDDIPPAYISKAVNRRRIAMYLTMVVVVLGLLGTMQIYYLPKLAHRSAERNRKEKNGW